MFPAFLQHHINLEPGQLRRKFQRFQPLQGNEHKLFAEGEVFQQQLIAAEGTFTFWPQLILFTKTLRGDIRVQRLTIGLTG
ncbi:hypothetical protein D3C80_2081820 [compost metagenome]